MTLEWKVRSYRSENGRKIMGEDRRSLENKDFLQISQLVLHSKKNGLPIGSPFFLGSAAQRAAPPFGISMLGVGRAAPAPRFSPAVKTLVRRTRAAAQKGRLAVLLQ